MGSNEIFYLSGTLFLVMDPLCLLAKPPLLPPVAAVASINDHRIKI